MKNILVLGIGNKLMMDDGIGIYAVEELKNRIVISNVNYIVGETDTYFCLKQIEESSYIIIIDAAYLKQTPGDICIFPIQQIMNELIQPISDHEANLFNEIKLIKKSIHGIFLGIEPYEIGYSPELSTILQNKFSRIVDDLEKIIQSYQIIINKV